MPYIVTIKRDITGLAYSEYDEEVSRRAVATLDEAAEQIYDAIPDDYQLPGGLPEQGGTIGPLPDGTVIEVEPISIGDLARISNMQGSSKVRLMVAAYNVAQENR